MSYLVRVGNQNPVSPWNAMDQMMDRFFRANWPFVPAAGFEAFTKEPVLDMYRKDGKIHLDIELPGLSADDIQVKAFKDHLELKAEKKVQSEDKDRQSVVSERYYGSFARTIALPEEVDPATLSARYADGVLHLEAQANVSTSEGHTVQIQR